ncbi:MAG TPA: mechanosensitive ion channel domain-containing protein [Phycisphaerales bacterium]|nr:mechanosensitive ion channel domain-containing protein [Phycisphaerales bacterium]
MISAPSLPHIAAPLHGSARDVAELLLAVAIILAAAHLAVLLVRRVARSLMRSRVGRSAKARTLVHFIGSVAAFLLYFAGLGLALRRLGVPLEAYVASATVIGFAVSFGSQSVIQDVLSGLTLISSDLLDVGDMVDLSGQVGIVRGIGIRYTHLTTLTGSTVSIPNRNVTNVINFRKGYAPAFLDVRLPRDHEHAAREQVTAIARAAFDQFRGVMPRGPIITEPRTIRSGERVLRVEFRTWPGQGPLVEAVIRPSILAAMRELDPAYPDWMAPVHYRAEPDEVPRRTRPRGGRTPPPAEGEAVRTETAPPDADHRRTGRAIGDA